MSKRFSVIVEREYIAYGETAEEASSRVLAFLQGTAARSGKNDTTIQVRQTQELPPVEDERHEVYEGPYKRGA